MSQALSERPAAATFEDTIRQLKDRVDILETLYAYCRHADNLDGKAMAELFVEDCVSQFIPGDEWVLNGRPALEKFLCDALAVTVSGSHHIANPELTFETPDRVVLNCYMYSWQRFNGFPITADCHRWGRYENRFVRTPAGWRLSATRKTSDGS